MFTIEQISRHIVRKRQTNRPVDRLTDASLPLCPTCWALGGQGPREHGRTHTCVPGLLLLLEDRSSIATPVVPLSPALPSIWEVVPSSYKAPSELLS